MAEHFEVYKLQKGCRFDICIDLLTSSLCILIELTHVLRPDFCLAFFQTVLDIPPLVSLVVPQTSDEVVKGLFEPFEALATIYESGAGSSLEGAHGDDGCLSLLSVRGIIGGNSYQDSGGIMWNLIVSSDRGHLQRRASQFHGCCLDCSRAVL